jgi:hypothetical protein
MSGYLWTALVIIGGLVVAAVGDMASEEIRDRLDHLPQAVLRLAARELDPGQRVTVYQDEWLAELTYILKGAEARPITRLITGTWYALGILARVRRIAPHLHRPVPALPSPTTGRPVSQIEADISRANLRNHLLLEIDIQVQDVATELHGVTSMLTDQAPRTFSNEQEEQERWRARHQDLLAYQATLTGQLARLRAEREALAKKDLVELAVELATPAQTNL